MNRVLVNRTETVEVTFGSLYIRLKTHVAGGSSRGKNSTLKKKKKERKKKKSTFVNKVTITRINFVIIKSKGNRRGVSTMKIKITCALN